MTETPETMPDGWDWDNKPEEPKPEKSQAEKEIDAAKSQPVLSIAIWWCREQGVYIASAPNIKGVIGCSKDFAEAAVNLRNALSDEGLI